MPEEKKGLNAKREESAGWVLDPEAAFQSVHQSVLEPRQTGRGMHSASIGIVPHRRKRS